MHCGRAPAPNTRVIVDADKSPPANLGAAQGMRPNTFVRWTQRRTGIAPCPAPTALASD